MVVVHYLCRTLERTKHEQNDQSLQVCCRLFTTYITNLFLNIYRLCKISSFNFCQQLPPLQSPVWIIQQDAHCYHLLPTRDFHSLCNIIVQTSINEILLYLKPTIRYLKGLLQCILTFLGLLASKRSDALARPGPSARKGDAR